MKMQIIVTSLAIAYLFSGCEKYESPEKNQGLNDTTKVSYYQDLHDPISDKGQYVLPAMTVKPKRYWNLVEVVSVGSNNTLGQTEKIRGLQYHLMAQSLAGLANRAVQEGKSEIGVWLHDHSGRESYQLSKQALGSMGISEQGMQSGLELARNNYGPSDGIKLQLKDLVDGYVLTDITKNPESAVVAAVASHIYNSIIVDVRDTTYYKEAGYKMKYNASAKSTKDAWNEFKGKCNNKALVVMPVQTGELRDYAIQNNLFVLNINKKQGTASGGQNLDVLEEVLKWLAPGAPILGWEQGVDEDLFVNRASKNGNAWVPSDWIYNLSLTSLSYKTRQPAVLARVENPQFIDFTQKKNFVSFYLSDGDNVQWMMNDFSKEFYLDPKANSMKMAFGLPVTNLSMTAPDQFKNLLNLQKQNYTAVEALGGGYMYVDNFGQNNNRTTALKSLASRVAAGMRQHRVKVLGLMAQDVASAAAKEGYKAFIEANDQLEGIVVMQYSPYAGGKGEIYWIANSQGYDIPVITVRYSLWNFGSANNPREGTPAFVSSKLKAEAGSQTFSVVAVHAWSKFRDIGTSTDLTAENASGGTIKGAGAAALCANHLGDQFKVIGVQEMIWRIRMEQREEQTKKYLKTYF